MIPKAIQQTLVDKYILCFGHRPTHLLQTPGRIEWIGSYGSFQGGLILTSAINQYLYAAVGKNGQPILRIFSSGFPAVTLTLDDLWITPDERYTPQAFIKGIVVKALNYGLTLKEGLDVFIQSDLTMQTNLGSSTAFALTILEAILFIQPKKVAIDHHIKTQWIKAIEQHDVGIPGKNSDALTMLMGGTLLVDNRKSEEPFFQRTTNHVNAYQLVLLKVKSPVIHPRMLSKQILDQMAIIAQHYEKEILVHCDALSFQHDQQELTRMYGNKTINKAKYFFSEQQACQLAFLSIEKEEDQQFAQLVASNQVLAESLLEHHLLPHQNEQPLLSTISWLKKNTSELFYHLHGLGFQGPILLIIPQLHYRKIFSILKRQFYEHSLTPIQVVNRGIQVTRL